MARRHIPYRVDPSSSFNSLPPGGAVRVPGADKTPGLTPTFNAAANHTKVSSKQSLPASKERIKELEQRLSRTAHTAEMTPFGNVIGNFDPKRDRQISHEIKAMQEVLSIRNDMARKAFTKAQLKNKAKQSFNRSSGMGM